MKTEWIQRLERFLEGNDFGKNWDGAYQDAVPTLRKYFHAEGFRTHIASEWESESRETELVARHGGDRREGRAVRLATGLAMAMHDTSDRGVGLIGDGPA